MSSRTLLRYLFSWPSLALIAVVWGWLFFRLISPPPPLPATTVSIDGKSFLVEQAVTPSQHARGLMWRTELPEGKGMIFIYPEKRPLKFWMKNTLIPLDILFFSEDVNSDELVLDAWYAAVPCPKNQPSCPLYGPDHEVRHVVELPSGTVSKMGWQPGVRLRFISRSSPNPR